MNMTEATQALIDAGRALDQRGWVPATSGNFSVRLDEGDLAITASGNHKGHLRPEHIMQIGSDGQPRDAKRPSAETDLHLQLYRREPAVAAVLHTHSVGATIASMEQQPALEFSGLEILKAFAPIKTHETTVSIPVFPNSQDIDQLAADVDEYMTRNGTGFAYLIRGHGLYTWGENVEECLRHLEALEFLFEYHRLAR